MLKLHLKELLVERGIKFPYNTLLKLKIGRNSAKQMLKGEAIQIRFDHLYKLCVFLNCTPKELIVLSANSKEFFSKNDPLHPWIAKEELYLKR